MQVLGLMLLGILVLVLESSLFNYLQVAGVKPDLLLITLIFYTLRYQRFKGCLLGASYGALEDLYLGHFLGSNTFIKLVIGFWARAAGNKLNCNNPSVFIFLVLASTIVSFVLLFVFNSWATVPPPWFWAVQHILLPELIYNGSLAFLFHIFYQEGVDLLNWRTEKKRHGGKS